MLQQYENNKKYIFKTMDIAGWRNCAISERLMLSDQINSHLTIKLNEIIHD